jgi:hypothetical protein
VTDAPKLELETLRESQDRALYREGIPMFVALADERGREPRSGPPDDDATNLVARLQHYRAELGPHQRDTDMGFLISALTAVAYEDFNRSVPA